MFCPNCGTAIPADSKFCYKCGSKIEKDTNSFDNPKKVPDKAKDPKKGKAGRIILIVLIIAAIAVGAAVTSVCFRMLTTRRKRKTT